MITRQYYHYHATVILPHYHTTIVALITFCGGDYAGPPVCGGGSCVQMFSHSTQHAQCGEYPTTTHCLYHQLAHSTQLALNWHSIGALNGSLTAQLTRFHLTITTITITNSLSYHDNTSLLLSVVSTLQLTSRGHTTTRAPFGALCPASLFLGFSFSFYSSLVKLVFLRLVFPFLFLFPSFPSSPFSLTPPSPFQLQ